MISGDALKLETVIAQLNDLRREFDVLETAATSAQQKLSSALEHLEMMSASLSTNDVSENELLDNDISKLASLSLVAGSGLYGDNESVSEPEAMEELQTSIDSAATALDDDEAVQMTVAEAVEEGTTALSDEASPQSVTTDEGSTDESSVVALSDDFDFSVAEASDDLEMPQLATLADDAFQASTSLITDEVDAEDDEEPSDISATTPADEDTMEVLEAIDTADGSLTSELAQDDTDTLSDADNVETESDLVAENDEDTIALISEDDSDDISQADADIIIAEIELEDDDGFDFDETIDAESELSSDTSEEDDLSPAAETNDDDAELMVVSELEQDDAVLTAEEEVSDLAAYEGEGEDEADTDADAIVTAADVDNLVDMQSDEEELSGEAEEVSDDECQTSMHQPVEFDAEEAAEDLKSNSSDEASITTETAAVIDDAETKTEAEADTSVETASDTEETSDEPGATIVAFPAPKDNTDKKVRKPRKRRVAAAFTGIAASIAAIAFALQMPEFQNLQDLPQVDQILQRLSELQRFWA